MHGIVERVLHPGMHLMRQCRLPLKFALVSAAFLVPLCVTLYAAISYANAGIEFAERELQGTTYLRELDALLNRTAVDSSDLGALRQLVAQDQDSLEVGKAIDVLTNFKANDLSEQLANLYTNIGDNSGLILDPDLDSFYTMAVVVDYGPKLVAVSRALGQRLTSSASDPAAVADIRYQQARLHNLQVSIEQSVQRATRANASLTAQLTLTQWQQALQKLSAAADAVLAGNSDTVAQRSDAAEAGEQTAQLMDRNLEALSTLLNKRVDGFKARRNGILLLTFACLLLSSYLITCFYVGDRRGLEALQTRMQKLAKGDLTVNYQARGRDEIGMLINAFNDSRAQLQVLVERIHHAADTISTAGKEISSANMDLAQRSSTQAAVIDETATRVSQVSEKAQANLSAASNANRIVGNAQNAAGNGKTVVNSVVDTMNAMTGSSKRIGAIIDVINEIAFQTNLLALNAAVEAARAGEQGRGFAVVAGEVRNLAQRCATAANEITDLIQASVNDVDKGNSQVAKAGASMSEILGAVASVSDLMNDMTQASHAQIQAMGGIDSAVAKINGDAQQNAALVEQTAAAADLLREQVEVLMESVSHFTLGSELARSQQQPPLDQQTLPEPLRRVA